MGAVRPVNKPVNKGVVPHNEVGDHDELGDADLQIGRLCMHG